MELLFLGILFLLMIWALTSGFPVAFALPGSAILSIALAAAAGYFFEGNVNAYFAQDGPSQWLSAGVTNFRSLYWIVERDTLIAIPLFIFMGIMLQRSKIAEDLLVAMAQLFGPLPGGLGISVVFVGALLAATTGIVGATVIAMGLISLPAMLRNNYSKSLATGTICASGTLGQIIPPSIVLIILADQLSSAADQASTLRKALYKSATGEYSMPSYYDVVSASAGDMFMGALVPGLILVGIYMIYILVVAWFKPEMAPPVPYDGKYDRKFAVKIFLALIPPLSLIFIVLGSIILGVATVNQAGAIGAIGAMIMAGYRLHSGKKIMAYIPAVIALVSIGVLAYLSSHYDLNVKNIKTTEQFYFIKIAIIAVVFLLLAIAWSAWRIKNIDDTLKNVMIDTAKMTSMVFIILIGAAMLTAAFRGFGGEELVKNFLTTLPGGFWTQFIVVMLVIFLLGFFLDFIEIAVVVVPIVAPILLANPEANVTAVWLGVMIGLNIQTSFLTPPFGFALFYLRGVADKVVRTVDIYKGASAFITLQLIGLLIVGLYPSLVNYLPNRTHLLSETAPPPLNPKLQPCLEDYVVKQYSDQGDKIKQSIQKARQFDISYLPQKLQTKFQESLDDASNAIKLIDEVKAKKATLEDYTLDYKPLHKQVSLIQSELRKIDNEIAKNSEAIDDLDEDNKDNKNALESLQNQLKRLNTEKEVLQSRIPEEWQKSREKYKTLDKALEKARRQYFNAADSSYQALSEIQQIIADSDKLKQFKEKLTPLETLIETESAKTIVSKLKALEAELSRIKGSSPIKSKITKARRAFKKAKDEESLKQARNKAIAYLKDALSAYDTETNWRNQASKDLKEKLADYDKTLRTTIGLRLQKRLTDAQAKGVAACLSHHRNISLRF